MHYIKALLLSLLTSPVAWAAPHDPVLESMTPGGVTLIGETHQRLESIKLIQDLATEFLGKHKCLILALEIDEDQQQAISGVMTKGDSVFDVAIPEMIDHLAMRKMIEYMAGLKTRHPCLKVIAIDTGINTPYDRDEWMATKIEKLVRKDTHVLALLGSMHTLKKVDWLIKAGKPKVAETLAKKGLRVKSFPQRWIPEQCPGKDSRHGRFVSADSPEAVTILNESMMSLLNARPHASAKGVVDGFILWECDSLPRDDKQYFGDL